MNKNKIKSNNAIYNESLQILESKGPTEIITSENYIVSGNDIIFDDLNGFINSNKKTTIIDKDKNKIYLENFEYLINDNIFKSIGEARVEDIYENIYYFSQVYIDTKKKELLGTDIKTFINNNDFISRNIPKRVGNI